MTRDERIDPETRLHLGPEGRDDDHVRLCAWLLGELPATEDPEGAAELERRVAEEPALATEAARIRATLAQVRAAFPSDDALSDARRQQLFELGAAHAASRVRARRWRLAVPMAAAALFAAAAGLFARFDPLAGPAGGERHQARLPAGTLARETDSRAPGLRSAAELASGDARETTMLDILGVPGARDEVQAAGGASNESAGADGTLLVLSGMSGMAAQAIPSDNSWEWSQGIGTVDATMTNTITLGSTPQVALVRPAPPTGVPSSSGVTLVPAPAQGGVTWRLDAASLVAGTPPVPAGNNAPAPSGAAAPTGGVTGAVTATARPGYVPTLVATAAAPTGGEATKLPKIGAALHLTGSGAVADPGAIVTATRVPVTATPEPTTGAVYRYALDFDVEVANGATVLDLPVVQIDPGALLQDCRRRPGETPAMMFFRFWGDNPFVRAARDPVSTFAVDVDTASYALARRYLESGRVPEKAAIRTEEFVNYFKADVAPPDEGVFRVAVEGARNPFRPDAPARYLLRVTLRGREVSRDERPPQRLTFVVDTSGSMAQENRIALVKQGLHLLVDQLDERDEIAIVAFSTEARLVLPMTPVVHRGVLAAAIDGLSPNGNTNAEAGLKLGYELAAAALRPDATSRVVLLSDGVANVGQTDQDRIADDVASRRDQGVYLNTIGVGLGNHNDVFLEQLADRGDGVCNYVDSEKEARRALVENFTGAMIPIARDVKIQVEFDPAIVGSYRQLGYENRAVADADFRNDAVDGGEVGAGHQITALYEIEPIVDLAAASDRLATVRVRYKPPFGEGDEAIETHAAATPADVARDFDEATPGYRRAVIVARFAELLRRSVHAADGSLDGLYHEARRLDETLDDPDFTEFVNLVDRSRALVTATLADDDPLRQAVDAVRRNAVLRAELEDLAKERDASLLKQLEEENRKLEQRIRDLLGDRGEKTGGG